MAATDGFSETAGRAGAGGSAAADDHVVVSGATATAKAAPAPASGESGSGSDLPVPPNQSTAGLRAGSVDDNARFAEYLSYREAFAKLGIGFKVFDVSERHIFTVKTPTGAPVTGADIVITDSHAKKISELRTYADGRALWFPIAAGTKDSEFTADVTRDGKSTQVRFNRQDRDHAATLDVAPRADRVPIDVEFLVDATGSMSDEIAQLKASLADISNRVAALASHPDIRFALTIYRDHGDAFLTRTWNFSSDVAAFQKAIADVEAGGGGDTPEDVQQGLHDALVKPSWRDAGTVKLVFLIGDAPPHLDYNDDPAYTDSMIDAARQGIKIESLAASGLDDQGEYVWRQLAQSTLGQFLFLTYGPNGGPGDSTTHHVDGYSPTNLDDLVVNLISQEVAPGGKTQ